MPAAAEFVTHLFPSPAPPGASATELNGRSSILNKIHSSHYGFYVYDVSLSLLKHFAQKYRQDNQVPPGARQYWVV